MLEITLWTKCNSFLSCCITVRSVSKATSLPPFKISLACQDMKTRQRKRNPTSKLMLDRTAYIWERCITCTEEFHSSIRWLPKSGCCHPEKSIFCKIERKLVQEEIATTKLWFRAPQSASTGIASCLRWKQMPPSNSHIQNNGKTLLHSLLS